MARDRKRERNCARSQLHAVMADRRLEQCGPEGRTLAEDTFCKQHGGRDMTANLRYANKEAVRLAGVTAAEAGPTAQAQLDALIAYVAKIASDQREGLGR